MRRFYQPSPQHYRSGECLEPVWPHMLGNDVLPDSPLTKRNASVRTDRWPSTMCNPRQLPQNQRPLDNDAYVSMLFVDFSSAFNTDIPSKSKKLIR